MAELDNIVLDHLRHIGGALDDVRDDIREMKQRIRNLENQYWQRKEDPSPFF